MSTPASISAADQQQLVEITRETLPQAMRGHGEGDPIFNKTLEALKKAYVLGTGHAKNYEEVVKEPVKLDCVMRLRSGIAVLFDGVCAVIASIAKVIMTVIAPFWEFVSVMFTGRPADIGHRRAEMINFFAPVQKCTAGISTMIRGDG